MVVHVCTPAVQQLPYHMHMTAGKQLCIVNMFMVHVMAQNQTVTQPTQTSSRRLQMPTAKNIIQMLNSVSDSQPVDDVMMSSDAQHGLDADGTLAETPLAETLNDDGAAVVDSGGVVQAVKGLL
jgi:hypothetical protein